VRVQIPLPQQNIHRGAKAIRAKVWRLKKDWVVVGAIELVGGVSVAVVFTVFLRSLGVWTTFVSGWGFIFTIIGAIVLIHGLRAKDANDGRHHRENHCLYCGRRVEAGVMICPRCGGKPSDGKRP